MYRNSSYSALPARTGRSGEDSPVNNDGQSWDHGDVSINMEPAPDQRRQNEQAVFENVEQSTLGVEVSEGIRWMERNAVFIIILLVKFSVYHRYGELETIIFIMVFTTFTIYL